LWKHHLSVFTEAHEVAPHNAVALSLARAHVQVALHLGESGRYREAISFLDEVIQNYPQDWLAQSTSYGAMQQVTASYTLGLLQPSSDLFSLL